jgi:hypothetical protein
VVQEFLGKEMLVGVITVKALTLILLAVVAVLEQ